MLLSPLRLLGLLPASLPARPSPGVQVGAQPAMSSDTAQGRLLFWTRKVNARSTVLRREEGREGVLSTLWVAQGIHREKEKMLFKQLF